MPCTLFDRGVGVESVWRRNSKSRPPTPTLAPKPRRPKGLPLISRLPPGSPTTALARHSLPYSVMPKPVTRADLLERYEKLGYPNRFKFEQKHGLPMNLMGKMKLGGYASAASAHTLARLEAAIASEEEAGTRGHEAAPLPGPAEAGPPGGRPIKADTLSEDELTAVEEFVEAVQDSSSITEVDECNKLLTVLLIRGLVTDATGRVLQGLLSERRQSLKAQAEEQEKAQAGKEMTIRVIFVKNWTGGPLPGEGPR